MKNAEGWAIVDDGEINVRTVSVTPRAAIVNWLVVERGIQVRRTHSDADIEDMWKLNRGRAVAIKVLIVGVRISVISSEQ